MADSKRPEGGETTLREHASAMATRRWSKATKQDRKKVGKQLAAARRSKLTPEQRSEIARNAALARHGKKAGAK